MAKKKYDATSIVVLDEADKVRKNVGMYFGPEEGRVLHALREVAENCLDLFMKDLGNDFVSITVEDIKEAKKKYQRFTVIDHGPGIPIEVHPRTKISTLTTVLTMLHAGSNFDKAKESKGASRGKHGVGVSCVNAVSTDFEVWTCRNKKWYHQWFCKGKPKCDVEEVKFPKAFASMGADPKCGTIVQYRLDTSVMPDTLLTPDDTTLWASYMADLNAGFEVHLKHGKVNETFFNEQGVSKILEDWKADFPKKTEYMGDAFEYDDERLTVGLQWSSAEGEHVLSFVNGAETSGGGTHVKGVFDVINTVFREVKGRGLDFTPVDLRQGLLCVVHYRCDDDDYAGQSKERLDTKSAPGVIAEILEAPLRKWVNKNKSLAKDIVQRATSIKAAREEARQITRAAATLKVSSQKGTLLGTKLTQCNKKCPVKDRELFLVEGDSAGGTAKKARNAYFQEVLQCKGKGLNVIRATLAKALANAEVTSLLKGLGGDAAAATIKKSQVITQFRVGKIFLFSDADVDGKHIDALWLVLLYRFAPLAFKLGMVYKVNAPLYIMEGDYSVYGFTLEEIKAKMNPKDYGKITRCKGLGEFDDWQLAPFMDPETRNVTKITLPEAKKAIDEFLAIMGDDSSVRKQLLNIAAR